MGPAVLGGVVGALGADLYDKMKDRAHELSTGVDLMSPEEARSHMMLAVMERIERLIREAQRDIEPVLFKTIQLSNNNAYDFNKRKYKFVYIASTIQATLNVQMEFGIVPIAVVVGWNAIILPNRCTITMAAGGPNNFLLCYSDEALM